MPAQERTQAAVAMVRRLLGDRADAVDVVIASAADLDAADGADVGEVHAAAGRLLLRGTDAVAVAVALRHYLEHACGVQVTWLDEPLPVPEVWPAMAPSRVVARDRLRYHLNYVTFAYSTVFWSWERWEREIDRMALHGINAPLALTGHEAVWQAVLRDQGMPDDRIAAYLGGSTYLPFCWMGCLEGWDRPLPDSWIAERERLGQRILARQRLLGMRPVLPGFAGHVPAELAPDDAAELTWEGFRTRQLPPGHPRFMEFARALRAEQRLRFGGDGLYATDPFIEMVPPSGDAESLALMAQRILDGVTVDDAEAVWIFQAWPFSYRADFWTPDRVRAFLEAVPPERMLVLDLWAEHRPLWEATNGFAGRPWLWCMVHNFGERSGLFGDVAGMVDAVSAARGGAAGARLQGTGLAMEGLGTNPAVYDLVTDLSWDEPPDDVSVWLRAWARRRYGLDGIGDGHVDGGAGVGAEPAAAVAAVEEAWRLLGETVYGRGREVLAPSPVIRRPGRDDQVTVDWAPDSALPDIATAWSRLLSASGAVRFAGAFEHDLVDVAVQVLVGLAGRSRRAVTAAVAQGDRDGAAAAGATLLTLLEDLDTLLAARPEYVLGRWLAEARAWGDTASERVHLERSARRLLTVWGHRDTNLYDYSGRHWSGLVRGFYRPRFAVWLAWIAEGGSGDDPVAVVELDRRLGSFEELWISGGDTGPVEARGDAVRVAADLYERWSSQV